MEIVGIFLKNMWFLLVQRLLSSTYGMFTMSNGRVARRNTQMNDKYWIFFSVSGKSKDHRERDLFDTFCLSYIFKICTKKSTDWEDTDYQLLVQHISLTTVLIIDVDYSLVWIVSNVFWDLLSTHIWEMERDFSQITYSISPYQWHYAYRVKSRFISFVCICWWLNLLKYKWLVFQYTVYSRCILEQVKIIAKKIYFFLRKIFFQSFSFQIPQVFP